MDPKPSPSRKKVEFDRNPEKCPKLPFGMTFVLIEELIAVPVMRFLRAKLQEGPEEKAL